MELALTVLAVAIVALNIVVPVALAFRQKLPEPGELPPAPMPTPSSTDRLLFLGKGDILSPRI